ncbi:MAG TPA: YIP1 family protein [Humidesulfovibrio sp.]|uniref:YIP1 family protein n=1 Tax=Humidesulfovibrio sp. TaxID=2910988 RepID=UPI002B5FD933|nr:YIP1 family protein [Humidesulfovibrio sp.]HWR02793.1 YIP1 family protein [Humidesulfovibrio sp.]
MRILCPMCGFAREMDETKVPPRAQMATCPKCSHKFRFRVVDDLEPVETPGAMNAQPAAGDAGRAAEPVSGEGQPDPMAAQRAAAAAAWKRIQGPQATPPAEGAPAEMPVNQNAPLQNVSEQSAAGQDAAGQPLGSGAPLPEQAWQQDKTAGSPVPFEDLPRHGFFPGLWSTIRMLVVSPSAFFSAMPVHGGMAKPLAFHLLLAEFMVVCQYLWSMVGIGATAEYLGSKEIMDMGLGVAGAAPLLLFLVYPLLLVLRLMLMTGIIHLLLRTLRSGGSGAEATFRVLCYSAAPLVLGIIPGIGPLVGGAWSIGLTILGLKLAHRTQISAAMFAVLVPILMMLAAVLGILQGMVKGG